MSKPLISIVTVNLNNLPGLKRTVESVLIQRFENFEFLIIDGGSQDGSKEFLKAISDQLDYWTSQPDGGIYNAMNKGVYKAQGEYLLFLNSGDHFHDAEALKRASKYLLNNDLVYFDLEVKGEYKNFIKTYPEDLRFSYFLKDTLPHPGTFIRSSLFDRVGYFNENLKIVSDWKFFLDCVCKFNASYLKANGVLSTFYLDGLSSNPENEEEIKKEKKFVLSTWYSVFEQDYQDMEKWKSLLLKVRRSKKFNLLVKLGFINKV